MSARIRTEYLSSKTERGQPVADDLAFNALLRGEERGRFFMFPRYLDFSVSDGPKESG
jgi:hypothetical protein